RRPRDRIGRGLVDREALGQVLAQHQPENTPRLAVTRSRRLRGGRDGREHRAEDREETEDTGAGHGGVSLEDGPEQRITTGSTLRPNCLLCLASASCGRA